ncbi:hypothetical protein [Metapseudomonas otitidis]|uniref:hypothetical protein n=1 Tax=Metapseudomonas otitidis TaxID=319939 RepID=UPI0013F59F6E|nr:hypothetical protein [Pseudomonas otitidis]
MKRCLGVIAIFGLAGCVNKPVVESKPYDSPMGYVVYSPRVGVQVFDGQYLENFRLVSDEYLSNCVSVHDQYVARDNKGELKYDLSSNNVYLRYVNASPKYVACDIDKEKIALAVESYIESVKSRQAQLEIESANKKALEKSWRARNTKLAASDDANKLFLQYCSLLIDATGNSAQIDDLRTMKHEYVGPSTNNLMFRFASNLIRNAGGYAHCEGALPQVKERIYTLGIDPTR